MTSFDLSQLLSDSLSHTEREGKREGLERERGEALRKKRDIVCDHYVLCFA
jgi:hypothetical protein